MHLHKRCIKWQDHLSCRVLITLGGYRYLDGLEQRWSCGKSWLFVLGHLWCCCEGCYLPWWSTKDNSSKLLVSLSYLTCG